jgi:hypothetical protein
LVYLVGEFELQGNVLQEYGTTLISLQEPVNGQPGLRCDTIDVCCAARCRPFQCDHYDRCDCCAPRREIIVMYMPKIQQAMLERGTGISLDCVDVNGVLTMQIVGKPAGYVSGAGGADCIQRRVLHGERSVELPVQFVAIKFLMYNTGMSCNFFTNRYYYAHP